MGAWLTMDICSTSRGALSTAYLVDDHIEAATTELVGASTLHRENRAFTTGTGVTVAVSDPEEHR